MRQRGFYSELKRRRVVRMAAWYAAGAFVVVQGADITIDAFYLPTWLLTTTVLAAFAGFPIALLLSWQFDITPDGVRETERRPSGLQNVRVKFTWPNVAIPLLIIVGITVAALSTATTRRVLAFGRAPVLRCADGSTTAPCRHTVPMESNRFVVLPLTHRAGADPGLLDGEMCADLIAEGLSHWEDIKLADHLRVNDALRRLTAELRMHLPVDSGLAVAHEVGAGKLIMGELWGVGDTTRITVSLYDVSGRHVIRQRQARFPNGSAETVREFHRLARQLVLDDARVEVAGKVASATRSFVALMAYDSALKAIRAWDLKTAKHYFSAALERDAGYSYARLWLAYTMLWQNDTTDAWRFHAARAAAQAETLGPSEALLAQAIAALADRRYADACSEFRQLLQRDSASFFGWSGLSECLARDNAVVPSRTSPSGWAFATSGQEAIEAQRRALTLVPSFNSAFRNLSASRLGSLLYRRSSSSRRGVARQPDTTHFAAFPALDHDTLAFTPHPVAEWGNLPVPATNAALVDRHRRVLLESAVQWAGAFPRNPRAFEALAQALEQTRQIEASDLMNESALSSIREAQRLETDGNRKLIMSIAEVRMLVKVGNFREARRLAERILADDAQRTPAQARRLAALAALTGRADEMASLLRSAASEFDIDVPLSGERPQPPLDLARPASALLAYASFGAPRDTLMALTRAAHNALATYVPQDSRDVMHAAVLDRADRMLFPVLGAGAAHRAKRPKPMHLELQSMLARGDTVGVRSGLHELDSLQAGVPISDIAADGMQTEIELALAVADTARAIRKLDRYLARLSDMSEPNFAQPYQPAAVVQLMRMRAELAAHADDRETARRWSRAVVDLWQNSDKTLKPIVKRMRSLARS